MMQIEGAYTAEVMKLMEYAEDDEDTLREIVGRQLHDTNSTPLQTGNNSKKYFQSETKQIKHIIAQNIKEKWE
jgi:hypothetical protein